MIGARNNTRTIKGTSEFIVARALIYNRYTRTCKWHAQIRVVRPRTRSTCVLGRTHAHVKEARTDVGRSPHAIDTRARVGGPRSHARITLSGRT